MNSSEHLFLVAMEIPLLTKNEIMPLLISSPYLH